MSNTHDSTVRVVSSKVVNNSALVSNLPYIMVSVVFNLSEKRKEKENDFLELFPLIYFHGSRVKDDQVSVVLHKFIILGTIYWGNIDVA